MNSSAFILNYWKHLLVSLFAVFCSVMLISGCAEIGVALIIISLSCILIPVIVFFIKRPKWLVIDVVSKWLFIAFMAAGGVLLMSGLIGIYQNDSFFSGACSGVNFSLKLALSLLKFAAKAL